MSDPRAFYDPNTGLFLTATLQFEAARVGVGSSCPNTSIYWVAVVNPATGVRRYDYPRSVGMVAVEPDCRRSTLMIVNEKLGRLPVRDQPHPFQAYLSHARNHAEHRIRRRRFPNAAQFQRG